MLPLDRFIAAARKRGIVSVIDGAQAVPHLPVDVQALGCDFYAFSAHKMYGPTGIGVLLRARVPACGDAALAGRRRHDPVRLLRWLDLEPPAASLRGRHAEHRRRGRASAPRSTTSAASARRASRRTSRTCSTTPPQRLAEIEGLALVGTAPVKSSLVSFAVEGIHPHDLGTVLDSRGVAVRTGHHCAMPVMEYFGVPATTRASFALYNTRDEVDALLDALLRRHPDAALMDLAELYRDVIVDHNRSPRNRGRLRGANASRRGRQPAVRRPAAASTSTSPAT